MGESDGGDVARGGPAEHSPRRALPSARAMTASTATSNMRSPTAEALEDALGSITDEDLACLLLTDDGSPLESEDPSGEAEEALLDILKNLEDFDEKSSDDQLECEPEAKKRKRLERNRASAALSRERKRTQLRSLEVRCRSLENANAHLNFLWTRSCMENQLLKEELVRLRKGASGSEEGAAPQSAVLHSYDNEIPPQLGGPHRLPFLPSTSFQHSEQESLRVQLFCLSLACSLYGTSLEQENKCASTGMGPSVMPFDPSTCSPYELEVFVRGGGHRKCHRRRRKARARQRFLMAYPELVMTC